MILQRVISAVFIALLLIGAVLMLPPFWSAVALSIVLLAATWEWSGFLAAPAAPVRAVFILVTVAAAAALWWLTGSVSWLRAVLWIALAFWSLALLWMFFFPRHVSRALVAVVGVLALSLAWVAVVRMRLDLAHGAHAVMYSLLIVWLADSGAYFAGRAFGRRKLAPAVSPGKTWAGLWGGLLTCAALAVLTSQMAGVSLQSLLPVTLVVGVFSVVGDLTESLCKRFAGLKDSGSLIPGHGGVLDRFDSLLAAAPILLLGIELLPALQG